MFPARRTRIAALQVAQVHGTDALRRLTWFSLAGEVLRTATLKAAGRGGFPEPVGLIDGHFIAVDGFNREFGRGERRDTVMVYVFSEGGELTDSIGPFPGPERFFYRTPLASFQLPPIFGRTLSVASAGSRIATGVTDTYAFDVYNGLRCGPSPSRALDLPTAALQPPCGTPVLHCGLRVSAVRRLDQLILIVVLCTYPIDSSTVLKPCKGASSSGC